MSSSFDELRTSVQVRAVDVVFLVSWLIVAAIQTQAAHDVLITMQRTPCFGTCPAYTVTITGDGRVEYEGKQFVHVTGRATATISPAEVAALVEAFDKAGYFTLNDRYTANITDMPTTITSIRIGERFKQVIDYYGAPQVLKDLEKQIDRVAGTARWVSGE
jgi:hypothetical protein